MTDSCDEANRFSVDNRRRKMAGRNQSVIGFELQMSATSFGDSQPTVTESSFRVIEDRRTNQIANENGAIRGQKKYRNFPPQIIAAKTCAMIANVNSQ